MSNITKFEQQNKDLDTLRAMAGVAIRSGKYGVDYNEATVLNIFMTARALGVDPMLALNGGFNIIKGKINMGAHFMSALARRAGHSIKVIEMSDQKCIIIAKRKDNDDSFKYEMTIEEARKAGLTNKPNWQTNTKQMLYCGCMRNVFRILFSDIAIPYDADEMNVEQELKQPDDIGLAEVPQNSTIGVEGVSPQPKTEIIDSRPVSDVPGALEQKTPIETLKSYLEQHQIPTTRLDEWVAMRCQAKGEQPENILKACLGESVLPKVKKSFVKWLESQESDQAATA